MDNNIIMNKKLIWGIIIVVVLGGLLFTFTKKADEFGKGAKTEIKLGMMFPLTSPYSAIAEGVRNGALLAIDDWQKTHPNVKVDALVEDDGFDAKKGISAYTKLKNIDKIDAVFSISTPVLDALYKTYQQDGLPVINIGLQSEGAAKDNIFQIFPDAKGQVKPLADYMQSKTNYDSVVIIHSTNVAAYAQFYNEFTKLYSKPYKDVVMNSKDDSKSAATKTASLKNKAVVIILPPDLGAMVTKDLLTISKDKMDYFYEASIVSGLNEYTKILGDMKALNGATTIRTVATDLTKFKADYKVKFGIDASIFAEDGYDSTMILLNNYNKDKTTWVNNIQNSSYVGPSGKTKFDDLGIRIPEYEVVKVVDGVIK
jgi:branched-chain amino acid transport system substrate-binding protein